MISLDAKDQLYQLDITIPPQVSYINQAKKKNNWKHPPRISGEYVLFILTSGNLFLQEGDNEYHLTEGDVLLLDPTLLHRGTKPSSCTYYYIHFPTATLKKLEFSDDYAKTFLLANRSNSYNCNPFGYELYEQTRLIFPKQMRLEGKSSMTRISAQMQQAILASERRMDYFKVICSSCFLQIITELGSHYSGRILETATSHFTKTQVDLLQNLMTFIFANYTTHLSSLHFEKHFHMSFDYLNRLFGKKNNITLFAYINNLRINKAAELLIHENFKSYEIAERVGYRDEYYFSKVFKKHMGISPRKYKQIYQ